MSFMKSNKIILFDLDGVVLNTEFIYLKLMLKYNENLDMPITKEYYIKNLLGKTKREISYFFSQDFGEKFNYDEYWSRLEIIRNKYLLNNKIDVKKGFLNLKSFLEQNNYKFGIVTSNSKKLTNELLINAGLNPCDFKIIVSRDDVVATKPNPDLYIKAMNHFKEKSERFIAIEDSNVGIQAALNAGIEVVNIEDIDIIELKMKSKCLASFKTLDDVIVLLKEIDD